MPLQFKFFFFLISIKTKTPIFGGYNCDHFEIVMGVSFCYNPKWCFGEGLTFEVNNITSTILMVFLIIPSNVCPPYSSDSNSSPNPTKIQNIQHDEWLPWMPFLVMSHSNDQNKGFIGGGGEVSNRGQFHRGSRAFYAWTFTPFHPNNCLIALRYSATKTKPTSKLTLALCSFHLDYIKGWGSGEGGGWGSWSG